MVIAGDPGCGKSRFSGLLAASAERANLKLVVINGKDYKLPSWNLSVIPTETRAFVVDDADQMNPKFIQQLRDKKLPIIALASIPADAYDPRYKDRNGKDLSWVVFADQTKVPPRANLLDRVTTRFLRIPSPQALKTSRLIDLPFRPDQADNPHGAHRLPDVEARLLLEATEESLTEADIDYLLRRNLPRTPKILKAIAEEVDIKRWSNKDVEIQPIVSAFMRHMTLLWEPAGMFRPSDKEWLD